MEGGLASLGQYGAVGLILAAVLAFGLRMTRRLFERQMSLLDAAQKFQEEQTRVMSALHHEVVELLRDVRDNHLDLLERLEMRRTPVHGMRTAQPSPTKVVASPTAKGRNDR